MIMKFGNTFLFVFAAFVLMQAAAPQRADAHHFKGLPHYNYFENYPQVPEEEFLGQSGGYEFSLVVYDFQGIKRDNLDEPNTVRLFLAIFELLSGKVYTGPVTLDILDGEYPVYTERKESGVAENLYSIHEELPDDGDYALRITLHDEGDTQCVIPFTLSSQKKPIALWVTGTFVLLIVVAAVGARKARVKQDRKEALRKAREAQKQEGDTRA
jgi:hypothetical protein